MDLESLLSTSVHTGACVCVSVSARDLTVLKLFEPCFLLLRTGVESREVHMEVKHRIQLCD